MAKIHPLLRAVPILALAALFLPLFFRPAYAAHDAATCSTTPGTYTGDLILHAQDRTLTRDEYWCNTVVIDAGRTLNTNTGSVSFGVGQETTPNALAFRDTGAKMYVLGTTNDAVRQYTLATPWDVSTATYDNISFSVTTQETLPTVLAFRGDGTRLYVLGTTNKRVFQYSLTTPWNVSSAFDNASFSVTTQDTLPTALAFRDTGAKMYVLGTTNDAVRQYTLATPWDVSTATYDNVSFSVTTQETLPNALAFRDTG